MAIIDVRILRSLKVSETKSDKGTVQLTASQELLIISDQKDPNFSDILADETLYLNLGVARIPKLNDLLTIKGIPLYVTSRELSYYKDNERAVVMTIKYDAKAEEQAEPPKPEDVDPETWQRITVTSQQITKPALGWKKFADIPGDNAPENDGECAQNSAGDPVDGLEEESSHVKLTYSNTQVQRPNFRELQRYQNRCNDAEFLGARKYTVRVAGWNAEYDQKNNVWAITVEFIYNPDGWQIEYFDVGYNQIKDGQRVAIVDKVGNPVSKPVPLDGAGLEQSIVTVGTGQPPQIEPVILELYPYRKANLSALFANCGI